MVRTCHFTAGDIGLIPDWEAKFSHAHDAAGKNYIKLTPILYNFLN